MGAITVTSEPVFLDDVVVSGIALILAVLDFCNVVSRVKLPRGGGDAAVAGIHFFAVLPTGVHAVDKLFRFVGCDYSSNAHGFGLLVHIQILLYVVSMIPGEYQG
jgi:hypothetical protein